jgi:hypothetical protein
MSESCTSDVSVAMRPVTHADELRPQHDVPSHVGRMIILSQPGSASSAASSRANLREIRDWRPAGRLAPPERDRASEDAERLSY